MFYDKELEFLKRIYKKYNLSVRTVPETAFYEVAGEISDRTIYRAADRFNCHYIFLKLPAGDDGFVLVIGPYTTEPLDDEQMMEYAETIGLSQNQTAQLIKHYKNVPLIPESSRLFAVVDAFCDVIWDGEAAAYVAVNSLEEMPFSEDARRLEERDGPQIDMAVLEQRYALENEIMEAVKHGQVYKSEMFTGAFSPGAFEQRLSDSVRNAKNYMIIMNTLLRKAAQEGGVHPFYLDKMSSKYAAEIEAIKSVKTLPYFMKKIFEDYCRLVNKHATKNYSALVKNVVLYVESNLSGDISLKQLAEMNGVSATYLSTTFKKETGKAFADYVNGKRIDSAKHLLKTTRLQIQTVAQHCGFLDVQYFAKVFKKYTGRTPREYRELKNSK